MSACPKNCTCLNPKCSRCRHPHKCSVVLDDENEVFCRCDNCGRFIVLNNTSNVDNMNDAPVDGCGGHTTEECFVHPHFHSDTTDPDPPEGVQNPDWDQAESLRVPATSLPHEVSTEAFDADAQHTHCVRFSNFGDQINTVTKHAFRKNGSSDRYYAYRMPLRAHTMKLRSSHKRDALGLHPFARSRRFFTVPTNNSTPTHLSSRLKGVRNRKLNHLQMSGYPSIYFQQASNVSQELRQTASDPTIEVNRNEQEQITEPFLNPKWGITEEEPQSEHHCSSIYGDTAWSHRFERNIDLTDHTCEPELDDTALYRFPRRTSFQSQCSPCLNKCATQCESCYLGKDVQRRERYAAGRLPSPPLPFCYENATYNNSVPRERGPPRICEQCLAERKTYAKYSQCCCSAPYHTSVPGMQKRYSSVSR